MQESNGNTYCVYCHISPDGRRYVGVTKRKPEKRWAYGCGYKENSYFTRAIKKYGWDSFEHLILCECLTKRGASELEKRFIAFYGTTDRNKGFNLEFGGLDCEKKLSEETKKKIGDSHRGRYTQAQIEATKTRRDPHYHHTDEIKKIIGDAHKGKPLSEEHKKKLSEAHKGKKPTDKNLEILRRINQKSVEQYDLEMNLIAVHDSIRNAANAAGTIEQGISACCRGRAKTSGGYIWRYAV